MQTYTIKEAARLSWLPESTLRYYETMWLIDFIKRGDSSKHRIYNDEDINIISAIACLNITGMSIEKMKEYLQAFDPNSEDHAVQLSILEEQKKKLAEEKKSLNLRIKYIEWKIKFWNLLNSWDQKWFDTVMSEIDILSKKLRFPWKYKKGSK